MVRYIVDSTFGVSKEYAEKHKIKIVQLKLILDDVVTDEGYPEEWEDFFTRFMASDNFPSTSQPNPEAYVSALNEIYDKEPTAEVIILTIAGALSGTINSARLAKEQFLDKKIAVIDSENTSVASLMILEELVEGCESGKSYEECIILAKKLINNTSIQFIPDSMKYLKRGGRVGTLGALIASIISIKPIFEFKKNIVDIPTKTLGMSKAIIEMIKRLPQNIKRLAIVYIHDKKNLPAIVQKVQDRLGIDQPEVRAVSPVFGVHVGIGAVGIACIQA